ncbi:protein of unknown function [Dyadobacter sp. SG02]|uniref:DUF4178 domain-containing protein n=1 Tax=Dyadobacter sp. SG02 TaxID=1855291 RepID=UPI0008D09274|nr:DUF4178 domain-containing protein [Dyadobacter sp. SG02]SEJ84912.1 protein of unknown function [Dyadobacter sp. SG02]
MGTSKLAICPSCGKPVYFQGSNNLAGCGCGKVWYRSGDDLTEVKMEPLSGTSDVIQPGTTGNWKDIAFTVTGRLRVLFEDQAYNYWTLDCNDGFTRHLAEGYGMYTICETLPFKDATIARKFRSNAQGLNLPDDREFLVTARNESRVVEIEGNVFAPTLPDRLNSIEASSNTERVELVAYSEEVALAFACHDIAPEMLFLSNTREVALDGKVFNCRNCHAENRVLTYPYGQSWVCGQCETRHSYLSGECATRGAQQTYYQHFSFDIGERITLDGGDYQVVGLAQKYDTDSRTDYWHEYTLYSKLHGFMFLTESAGHWTYLKETRHAPKPTEARLHRIEFDNQHFRRYSKYHYRILYALGEFPGDVFSKHEEMESMDYIAPPEIMSIERDHKKRATWFRGKYVPRAVIAAQSFKSLPERQGVAPAQPPWIKVDTGTIARSGVIAWVLAVLVQLLTGSMHSDRLVLDSNYYFADSLNTQLFLSEKFELEKTSSGLELNFRSPVENSWLELNATLVNTIDGSEYSAENGVEFYSGYEDGSHWTEGSQENSIQFTKIPAGTYVLQMTATRDSNMYGQARVFTAKLFYDPVTYRNMWIVILLILVWPLVMGIARYYTEGTRWGNSEFANS